MKSAQIGMQNKMLLYMQYVINSHAVGLFHMTTRIKMFQLGCKSVCALENVRTLNMMDLCFVFR